MTIRARIYQSHVQKFRGRLLRTWNYEVFDEFGNVFLKDNTGAFEPMLRAALIRVEALRHMQIAGHRLQPYKEDC